MQSFQSNSGLLPEDFKPILLPILDCKPYRIHNSFNVMLLISACELKKFSNKKT